MDAARAKVLEKQIVLINAQERSKAARRGLDAAVDELLRSGRPLPLFDAVACGEPETDGEQEPEVEKESAEGEPEPGEQAADADPGIDVEDPAPGMAADTMECVVPCGGP